jgi:AcrR family transcriptional regulator
MTAEPVPVDRRARRRQETIEEVLDIAVEIMVEQGVAGLSVGEVARRMGIRPPSLYGYFPSKHALYDALFARGAQLVLDRFRAEEPSFLEEGQPLDAVLLRAAESFVGWSLAHPAYTQLLFWRPVPGFTPTPEAYAPAVELVELAAARFALLQDRGLLCADADIEDAKRDWTILLSGVISQQLSNAPDEPLEAGRFTAALPSLVSMFARHYATDTHSHASSKAGPRTKPDTKPLKPQKETRRVRNR